MSYINKYGLINASQYEDCSENTILFSYEYWLLTLDPIMYENIVQFLNLCNRSEGIYLQRPIINNDKEDYMSHDQLITIMNFSYYNKLDIHKEIWQEIKRQGFRYNNITPHNPGLRFVRIRDLIYYAYLNNSIVGKLLFPIFIIFKLVTMLTIYKTRPYFWDQIVGWFKNGEWIPSRRMIVTDGKLILLTCLLSCNRYGMICLKRLCNWLIKKTNGSWFNLFQIYFPQGNPTYKAAKMFFAQREDL